MPGWIPAADLADCPPGSCLELVVEGRIVAVFNVDGELHALDGVCPHQGGPLGQGNLEGPIVTCPWHGWQFDVRDGQHQISPTLQQPTVAIEVRNDKIMVQIDETQES